MIKLFDTVKVISISSNTNSVGAPEETIGEYGSVIRQGKNDFGAYYDVRFTKVVGGGIVWSFSELDLVVDIPKVFILSISSKCEGVASGVVAYTTRKDWAEKWVAFNIDHRSYEEVACADSEMEEAIDGN